MSDSFDSDDNGPDYGSHFDTARRAPLPLLALHRVALKLAERPVAGLGLRALRRAESWMLIELKQRLERSGGAPPDPLGTTAESDSDVDPAQIMQALLRASRGTDQNAIEHDFYVRVLRQLNPSQARILVLMSDGGVWPMVHVCATSIVGTGSERILSYASSAGKEAGVLLRAQVPHFLAHMDSLGLLTVGAQDSEQEPAYEILEADTLVRDAMAYVTEDLNRHAQIERCSIRLSEFGLALCAAALPGHGVSSAALGGTASDAR
ncbi:Abi-alpha family protein [Salinisphaera aquimarina]|uniref:Abi-alpha family protein n=1 Tax=Salinisphaera aquimarina TaxID=2094031 RepID=A0ABV7EW58_9GAMM